jgi:uncharacterized protein YkuJ
MNQLKIISIGKKEYFLDVRLKQLRNTKNPFDFIDLNEIELYFLLNN